MRWMKALLITLGLLAALSAPAIAEDHGWGHEREHGWWGGIWGGEDDDDDGYIPYAQYVPYVDPYSIAGNFGWQDGLQAGACDREYHRGFGYRGGYYQHADHGYVRSYGDRGRYRNWYRQSYMRGYQEGFRGRNR